MQIDSLFSNLLSGTFAGVPFGVINVDLEDGRRTLQLVYPGVDAKQYQDLGADDGPMTIRGILAGQDYIAQAMTLRSACRDRPGPYTLVHPWLGSVQVVFPPGQKLRIHLEAKELLIARFEMQVVLYTYQPGTGLDTLSQLEVSCDEATAAAQNYLVSALAPVATVLGALSYAQGYLSDLSQGISGAIASTPSAGIIGAAAQSALDDFTVVTTGVSSLWASETAAAMVAVPAAIEGACAPTMPSAVAPGGTTTAAAAASPTDACNTLLAAQAAAVTAVGSPSPGPQMGAAMQAALVTAAVLAASRISYTSQQQAEAQAALLYAAIDTAATAAAMQAMTDPANAAPVWRALVALKGDLASDTNALIGRLPPVVTITTSSTVGAWVLAQYISGDTPGDLYSTYQDLIGRNAIVNPALVPPGKLEVLA
jgi:prophage DNA circulation protein